VIPLWLDLVLGELTLPPDFRSPHPHHAGVRRGCMCLDGKSEFLPLESTLRADLETVRR